MRVLLYAVAAAAVAMLAPPDAARSALAAAAGALFEATPFLLAGTLLARLVGPRRDLVAYLGCGCGSGPSARSLPAAAATWLLFGPLVAGARFAGAALVARLLRRRGGACAAHGANPLCELGAVLPAACIAGAALPLFGLLDTAQPGVVHVAIGAVLGFLAAPCALGAVALGGALHARAPLAAAAFLCVAGIADARALVVRRTRESSDHDALAYALLAVALGIVASRHGDALVHPAIAGALGLCAFAAAAGAVVYRRERCAAARLAPALMLVGALVGAPPPQYRATETTLTDLFAGERLSFTGQLARDRNGEALVRYAITCCRADAAPLAVRLARRLEAPSGSWLHVDGVVTAPNGELELAPQRVDRIAPPSDPFVYR